MKKEDMFEALSDIQDEYIEKAEHKKNSRAWIKWAAAAACVCLVILGAVSITRSDKETGSGYDAGGDGADGMYSIAVYPGSEREEDVESAEIISISESEAYAFEGLGEYLPTELPEGYFYSRGSLYKTVMKDGSEYYRLLIAYANGTVEYETTEDGGVRVPDVIPDEFRVNVRNYKPDTEPIYSETEIETAVRENDGGTIHFECIDTDGSYVYFAIEPLGQTDEDILKIIKSMF